MAFALCGAGRADAADFFDPTARASGGAERSLAIYRGKVVLVVNTASQCGYTPQLEGLQQLHAAHAERGFVVLGFPSDSFAHEPGSDAAIKEFCELRYRARFPLFAKAPVTGPDAQPVFRWLVEADAAKQPVGWNFEKFLIDRRGTLRARFAAHVTPGDAALRAKVEEALAETGGGGRRARRPGSGRRAVSLEQLAVIPSGVANFVRMRNVPRAAAAAPALGRQAEQDLLERSMRASLFLD